MWDFSSIANTNLEQKAFPWFTLFLNADLCQALKMPAMYTWCKIMVRYPITTFAHSRTASDNIGAFFLILRTFRNDLGLRQPSLEMDVDLTMHMGLIAMCDRPFRSNCRNVMFTHGKGTMMSWECAKQFVSMILAMVSVFLSLTASKTGIRLTISSRFAFVFGVFLSSQLIHQPPFLGILCVEKLIISEEVHWTRGKKTNYYN